MWHGDPSPSPFELDEPIHGYLDTKRLKKGVKSLKDYIKKSKALKLSPKTRKNLLEAGNDNPAGLSKVIIEVVFKNIPTNSRTYIHNIVLPHHWRPELEPEHLNIALFVRHRRPNNEAQRIQFSRDRDLDIDNTHNYYKELLEENLDETLRSRISRIISTKELATEFNTFQKLDRLCKTYDLFLSDKQLMANKLNPLPRRLGRRFWVREKKVPLMVKLDAKNLDERLRRALSTEQFYVRGNSATEQIQIGMLSQSLEELSANLKTFLDKLYSLYGDNVRFLRIKTTWGLALPLYADLSVACPKKTYRKKKNKMKIATDEFDMLPGDTKISVYKDGSVKVIKDKRKKRKLDDSDSGHSPMKKRSKKVRKSL